jgi:hypothetical protein
MFWNGDRWLPDGPQPLADPRPRPGRRIRSWANIGIVVLALVGLAMPASDVAAAHKSARTLIGEWSAVSDVSVVQESSTAITYRGTWKTTSYTKYLGGKARWTRARGARASLKFTGTAIAWVGPVGPTRGKARVYIDGTLVNAVNTWASSFRPARVLFTKTWATTGTHRITIIANGTPGHPTVALDAFLVRRQAATSNPAPAPNPTPTPSPTPAPASGGWQLVQSDDFNGSALDTTKWSVYGPWIPGHAGNGIRASSAVSVGNGLLTITAKMIDGTLVSGGTSNRLNQTYGRFEFRVRTDADPSQATSGVVLTWPGSGNWPIDGENDIYETGTEADRTPFASFIHYGATNKQYWFHHTGADGTQWHTMAMEWEPSAIRIYRDGALVWTVTDTVAIPDVAHHLAIQLDAFKGSMTGTVRLQVDWVRIYKRA